MYKGNDNSSALAKVLYNTNKSLNATRTVTYMYLEASHRLAA